MRQRIWCPEKVIASFPTAYWPFYKFYFVRMLWRLRKLKHAPSSRLYKLLRRCGNNACSHNSHPASVFSFWRKIGQKILGETRKDREAPIYSILVAHFSNFYYSKYIGYVLFFSLKSNCSKKQNHARVKISKQTTLYLIFNGGFSYLVTCVHSSWVLYHHPLLRTLPTAIVRKR